MESDASFERFVQERSTTLLRVAYLLTADQGHAEDLLQSVLEKVARRWSNITESPDAYARRALINASASRWRRRRIREVPLAEASTTTGDDPLGALLLRDQLITGLAALPARQRAVLVLRYFEDLSETEIATALGCSNGTVKSQCARGLSKLRAHIHRDEEISLSGKES